MKSEILWDRLWETICGLILLSKVLFLHSAEEMWRMQSHLMLQPCTFPSVYFKLLTWQSDIKSSLVHSLLQFSEFPAGGVNTSKHNCPPVLMISPILKGRDKKHTQRHTDREWRSQSMVYNKQCLSWKKL